MCEQVFGEQVFEDGHGRRRPLREVGSLAAEETIEAIVEASGELDLVRLRRLELIAHLEASGGHCVDGYTSVTAFLIHRCGLGAGAARREVALARRLADMVHAHKLAAASRLSINQFEVLADAAAADPAAYAAEEAGLAEAVVGLTLPETRRLVDYWIQAHSQRPDGNDPEPARVFLSRTLGGRGRLDGDLDPETYALLDKALDGLMTELVRGTPRSDLKAPSYLRGEALAEIARHYLDAQQAPQDRGNRPHVAVHIDWNTLIGDTRAGMSEFEDGTVITPEYARLLACDSITCRLLTGPRGEILDLGRNRRTVSPAQYRAVVARDRHCQFRGCRRPPRWCDVHHLKPWWAHWPTDLDNLVLICRYHHTLIHRKGFTLTGTPGNLTTTRPDGTPLRGPP